MHYGWIIALTSMVILMVSNGLTIPGINVFDAALLEEFGWARDELKRGPLITFILAGLLAPVAGGLGDRFGVKRLMLFGFATLGVTFLLYSRIQTLTQLYIMHALFALVLVTAGLVVNMMLVSNWFNTNRGTAIGLALVGTSLGGTFMPPLGTYLVQTYGWREAFRYEAILPAVLFFVVLFLVKNKPSDSGRTPVGGAQELVTDAAGQQGLPGMEFVDALRTTTFWALAVAGMATFYSILGAQAHLFLYLSDLGMTPQKAAFGLSLLFMAALVGKFTFGFLADRLPQKAVFIGNIMVMLLGAICLATMNVKLFWVADVLFGLGWGGLYALIQLLAVNSFGLKSAGKILGTITVFDSIGGGIGPFLIAVLYERTGSYQLPFLTLVGIVSLALLASFMVNTNSLAPDAAEAHNA